MLNRLAALAYGLFAYALFLFTSVFALCFLGNFWLKRTIDSASRSTSVSGMLLAILIDCGLLTLFAVQHSVMARPWFKRWWTKYVPEPVERSTYLVLSCVALGLIVALWEPIGGVIWHVQSPWLRTATYALYLSGWLIVVGSTLLINHFDLFGLRQVWLFYQGREYTGLPFRTPGPYRWIRHPLYVGWLTVFWAAPTMTVSHLLFAGGMFVYILLAIRWEERDLLAYHGQSYARYRDETPMLIPGLRGKAINLKADLSGNA
ncbi:methanethiol S-methyltransferase [Anatilimnocola floriformis]|uniref:methanethiol S-methyltransferase n=1 Tax=Anatilimnocola floriformis TaxID=2948575 RepID=UPI0020C23CE5|nr:methanethiol S-methyltransferase [Anatilimnocola floriformis]